MRPRALSLAVPAFLLALLLNDPTPPPSAHHDGKSQGWQPDAPVQAQMLAATPCVGGTAAGYPCNKVDLMAQMPLNTIGGGNGNDIWGWTDPQTGKEYALVGRSSGTSFVDISTPASPIYLGNLPTATVNSSWRDIEVYNNHAYIVSEASSHGLQVFDLTRLRTVTSPPVTFTADARNTSFSTAHTITVNTQTGFAYVNGSNTCSGGPRMFNLATPANPTFAGCVSADGYTHDSQAVIYNGPDTRYTGREILLNSNEDTITIFDVTTKSSPVQLSRTTYSGRGYVHQGWLTEDHRYFFENDETDEQNFGHNTRTRVFSMASLTAPTLLGFYSGPTAAIDHNLFIRGKYVYESNYTAGLRILDNTNAANPSTITEAGFFDVHPANNNATFNGTWANYPFFASGIVIVNSIEQGLFVLKPNLDGNQAPVANFTFSCNDTTLACSFDGSSSSDPDGTIASYAWNFGDGATGTGPTAAHTYAASGTYTVTLTVTDNGGATGALGRQVTVGATTTVFSDTFETATGWTTNAGGTDTATTGLWERGDPAATSSGGVSLQQGTTTSGVNDLVTGRLAGSSAGTYDVDGGVTTIRSPAIALPATGTITLSLRWYLAHLSNASSADFFRVKVIGTTTTTVFEQLGTNVNRAGTWGTATANVSSFAGQSVRIQIEAADAGSASLIEAGVDDLTITRS